MKNRYVKYFIRLFLIIGFVAALIGAGYFYNQYREVTGKNNEAATKKLVKKISKFMILPAGLPTLATVTDKSKLASQPFFRNAENGDKVLIYPEVQKVILYRPSKRKVVEVATAQTIVNTSEQEQALSSQQTNNSVVPTPAILNIAIYNGTTTAGLTKTVEKNITDQVKNITIGLKASAGKTDYSETQVIDVSGRAGNRIQEVATAVKGQVQPLPAGENKPDADILVIIGSK
jgi:hypothetical protein